MPKNNRNGQAAILTNREYAAIRKELLSDSHRIFLSIARWTGERWGAICQLQVSDCYEDPGRSIPRDVIIFRAATRKKTPFGQRTTRECPVHPTLDGDLRGYTPQGVGDAWLFPSRLDPLRHVTFDGADSWFRGAIAKAGLQHRGISTHSTRRTMITRLAQNGIDLKTIAAITGHKDLKSLLRYIEVEPDRLKNAIACLQ